MLSWLPIRQRIQSKIVELTFKTIQVLQPSCLFDLVTPFVISGDLRSVQEMPSYSTWHSVCQWPPLLFLCSTYNMQFSLFSFAIVLSFSVVLKLIYFLLKYLPFLPAFMEVVPGFSAITSPFHSHNHQARGRPRWCLSTPTRTSNPYWILVFFQTPLSHPSHLYKSTRLDSRNPPDTTWVR